VLEFSYIGYIGQSVRAGNKKTLNIVLVAEAGSLNEVVVVGYSTQKKGSVAAAVSTIKAEDLARTTSTTVSGALVGKTSGITFRQKSGQPGTATQIQIRNLGTPLFVIDGVMKDEGQFNNLDVNDIENISILKDGAAAIYGVKASNGVVLVTTKKGSSNQKPTVTLNTYYGYQGWFRYPQLLTAYEWQYANLMKDVNNGAYTGNVENDRAMLDKWKQGLYNPETGEDYRGYDWKKEFVSDNAPQKYMNVNVSGGNDKSIYYISLGHIDQDAVFKDYNFNRTNIQTNFETKLSESFKVGIQVNGRIETRQNPGMPGTDDYEAARAAVFLLPPIYRPFANDNPLYLNAVPGRLGNNLAAMTMDNAGKYKNDWRVIQANWNAEYKTPLKGLTAKALFSYYYASSQTDNFEKGWQEYTYNKTNDAYNVAYDKAAAGNTYLVKGRQNIQEHTGQFTLNYDNTFNNAHHITGVAGFEFYERTGNNLNIQQNPVDNNFIDLITTNEKNTVVDTRYTNSTASVIFRAGYDYKQKYIVEFAGRYDGSWKFPKGKRWGLFPSVQTAWRLSEEDFFKNSSMANWLTNVKLRASYGQMGDDNLGYYPDFAYLPGYNYNVGNSYMTPYPGSTVDGRKISGIQYKGLPITDLSWMTSTMMNAGIELGFVKNKLTAEFDVFRRRRSGIPTIPNDLKFPVETGLTALPQNLDSDETVGFDAFVRWNDKINDFGYRIGVNLTLARQKFGARYGERFFNSWDQYRYSQKDRWSNVSGGSQMWMWEVIGQFKTQEEIDNYPVNIDGANNANLRPGDLIFRDVNGDGIMDSHDERPLGYAGADWPWDQSLSNKTPLMTIGLNLGFDWKGIDVAADFAGGFMNTFVMDWQTKWGVDRTSNGYYYNSIDVWRHEDILDPKSPWVPGLFPSIGTVSGRWWNNYYTTNVNYVRLRNLVVGYTLPAKWTNKVAISKLRFYFQGSNLASWDNLKDMGFDPEISTVNGQDYPQHKIYTFGVTASF
jgi:TonB-linked SusC/RagA family outer membrane protein